MRKAFTGLAWLLLLAVAAQFFLAASGTFDTAPENEAFRPHRALGYGIVLVAVLATIVAALARMPGRLVGTTGTIAGLAVLQGVIRMAATAFDDTGGPLVFGLHAVNALVIIALCRTVIRQARERSVSVLGRSVS